MFYINYSQNSRVKWTQRSKSYVLKMTKECSADKFHIESCCKKVAVKLLVIFMKEESARREQASIRGLLDLSPFHFILINSEKNPY